MTLLMAAPKRHLIGVCASFGTPAIFMTNLSSFTIQFRVLGTFRKRNGAISESQRRDFGILVRE